MAENDQAQTGLIAMTTRQLLQVLAAGAVVGALMWGLAQLLDQYVIRSIVCKGAESMQCGPSLHYAAISATILASGLGLFILARLRIFRALLVIVAATISLWGIVPLMQPLGWQVALPAAAILFLAAYGLFAWVSRLRSFILALVVTIVLVTASRLVLMP